ncbi:MAG: BrnT family toxin [Alphaproteobacteria bacterium]|nr:BrnT family toxin [Alphaproteobacteria bacterium]
MRTRFEWDETKRLSNIAKHGLDFVLAAQMFDGRNRLDLASPRGGESRILSIGEIEGKIVAIAWTDRGSGTVRLISVRRASHAEERQYRQLHRGGARGETGER